MNIRKIKALGATAVTATATMALCVGLGALPAKSAMADLAPEFAELIQTISDARRAGHLGPTALHRLLTADPAHQGLEAWLTEAPQPRPPRGSWAANPVFARIQAGYERHHAAHPEFMGVHYMAADQVEECWQLLRQSMRSISFECLLHLPTYSSWLRGQDWAGPYRRHRRNLQLIGLPDHDRRWVLKNPSHLFALDALLKVYPDALIIQTHRSARVAIASACSLAAQASAGWIASIWRTTGSAASGPSSRSQLFQS